MPGLRGAPAVTMTTSELAVSSHASVAEMRIDIGFSAGHAARTARKTSSGKRMRFSSEPP